MSAGSGITEKGDAASATPNISSTASTKSKEPTAASTSKPSYATLNINDLYRGKSLEQSKTPAPRHGMQTLGKVVRRNQSAASTTGLTSADASTSSDPVSSSSTSSADQKQSGSDASSSISNTIPGSVTGSSLSSSSNSGWAAVSSADPVTASAGLQPDSCLTKPGTGSRQPSAASTGSGSAPQTQSTPWTAGQAAGCASGQVPERLFSEQRRGKSSLLPAQEFPELGVEEVPVSRQTETRPQPAADPGPYGPGPSLRPAIGANWSQGSANAAALPTSGVVNGSQPGDRNSQLNPVPGSQAFAGPTSTGNGGAGNMYRGQASGQRNAFPGAGGSALTSASGSDFRGNRPKSGKEEPPIVKFNASIMPDEKISEFDEILEKGDIRSDWTAICDAIDYDQDLNFDLDDSALDSAFKTKQTPISESNCQSSSTTASSAAIDVKPAASAGSRKVHAFEDEFTRSPPNSGRVLYDPRDQKQLRDNRSAGPRSRRTSEKSDDVHSEGRGSAPKTQSGYGRDGNRGPAHADPRDSLRIGYSSNKPQQMQQAQLPPRFQKQLLQQQQQQLQQNHHQQQHAYQQPGDRRYDSRGQAAEMHRRDGPGAGPAPHHSSEWRPQPQPLSQRNDLRPGHLSSHAPAATSAADEMNWRSASKKVTESSSSRSSDPRGPAHGISAEKEITILRHEKNPAVGVRPVSTATTATEPSHQIVANPIQSMDKQQLPVSKTSASDADSNAFPGANVTRPIPATGWTSDSDITAAVPAVQNNHWKSVPSGTDHPDGRLPLYDRSARTANLTTLGKKKTAVPSATSSDAVPDPSATSRFDDSSWRRKSDEQSNDRVEETKWLPPPSAEHSHLKSGSRPSHDASHLSLAGGRGGSGDAPVNPDSAPNSSYNKRTNEQPVRDISRQNVSALPDPLLKQNRNQRIDDRRRDVRPDGSRNETRGHNRRDEYQQHGQREQRRDGNRRRSQEDSMTFDYRDLPKNVLSAVAPEAKEVSGVVSANKDHGVGQQFPPQKSNDIHRKGQQTTSSRSSGPVLARVAGNSNYGPPPSKAAFESKSVASDSHTHITAASSADSSAGPMQQFHRQADAHSKRDPHDSKPVLNRNETSEWKKERPSVTRDDKQTAHTQHRNQHVRDEQRSNQRQNSQQNYDQRQQRDNRRSDPMSRSDRFEHRSENQRTDQRRENRPNDRHHRSDQRRVTPPESDIPPRFRQKVRSGTESSKGSRSAQGDKSRSSVSHAESDVGNEEWETASESSHKDLSVTAPAAESPAASAVTAAPNKSHPEKADHRNVRGETGSRKSDNSNTRSDRRRNDRSDGGRDDRRDAGNKKGGRSDERVRDERRNSNRNDQRYDGRSYRSHGDDGRRRRDDPRDHRPPENQRNKKWSDGHQTKGGHDDAIVQQMSQVKLDDPESAFSSLKKDLQSMTLNDRRDEVRGDHSSDGFSVVDRHKKRAKGSNEETESKKMKPEVSISSKSRHSKTSSSRVSSKMTGSRDMRLQKLSEDAFKVDPGRLSSLGGQDPDSPSKENAWSKPLSHAPPTRSTTSAAVTFASSKSDARPAPANAAQLAISSKTSSFEHQDSGVDVGSDHPQSAASSQRSSPNNGADKKTGQLPAKSPLAAAAPIAEESPEPPLHGTLIYENSRYRQQVEALSGMPDNVHGKSAAAPRAVRAGGNLSHSAAPVMNDYSNRSKVHPIRPPVHQQQNRPKDLPSGQSMTSDLDQKIASVKNVWKEPVSPGIAADMCGDHHPVNSKSPAIRNQYPPGGGVGPIGMSYGMSMSNDPMSLQMNSMKQMQPGRSSQHQQQPHPQYQRSLSGQYISSNSPPVNMMNQMASPPPQLDAMRQHLSQQQQHHQQQQQQPHYVQQQSSGGSGHGPSIPTPPVTHPMYNMATIANMYSPAFNQHMDPRASVQLQAFAQQLAFHQNQQNQQHPMRNAVQAAPHPAAAGHGAYGAAGAQMSDYRNMGQVPAVGQHQPQPHQSQQQQQSNLMKAQHQQYMQQQQPNFQFWNR